MKSRREGSIRHMYLNAGHEPDAVTVSLICPQCGAKGSAVWEKEKWGRSMAGLSGNFYERLAKFRPYKVEIVCHACGAQAIQRRED